MLPRVAHLMKTSFMKEYGRLVVSCVGTIAPGVFDGPTVCTVFEDCVHGGNMVASVLFSLLMQIKCKLAHLPDKLIIHADNTGAETKNTIVMFWAAWILSNSRAGSLSQIEFVFLMVGHTHDLVDQFFSRVHRSLFGMTCKNLNEFYNTVQKGFPQNKPSFFHLQDYYDFKGCRPTWLYAFSQLN